MGNEVPIENTGSFIEVRRSFRPVGFLARYLVFIDGVSLGEAKTGSFVKFAVPPGNHEVQIWNRAMRMCSDSVAISIAAGQTATFVCRSKPSTIADTMLGGPRHYRDSIKEVKRDGYVVNGGIALALAS
jgi:hypothetical protein